MGKIINPGNHHQQSLNPCNDKGPHAPLNIDPPPGRCEDTGSSQRSVEEEISWLSNVCDENTGIGHHALCDPMQTGQMINDLENPNRNTIYRYSKSIRGCDEATTDLFRNVVVIDTDGKASPVPIMWASQERAVAVILQDSVRSDNSLVIDRVRLPMMAIHQTNCEFNQDRYIYHQAKDYLRRWRDDGKPGFAINEKYTRDTVFGFARGLPVDITYELVAWTLYIEDMNQIVEQIMLKFSPMAYIRVRGVSWEIGVKLDGTANNLDTEPGDKRRVVKFQFNLKAESYIPQPITRNKAVLEQRINFFDSVDEEEMTQVIDRLEIAVRELE